MNLSCPDYYDYEYSCENIQFYCSAGDDSATKLSVVHTLNIDVLHIHHHIVVHILRETISPSCGDDTDCIIDCSQYNCVYGVLNANMLW